MRCKRYEEDRILKGVNGHGVAKRVELDRSTVDLIGLDVAFD
jgi:hypothetical protein